MKRAALLAILFTGLAGCDTPVSAPSSLRPEAPGPSFAQAFNDKIFVSGTLFNPCPPEEFVAFEGFVHSHATGDLTPPDFDFKFHFNAQGVEGVGLTSGDGYSIQENAKDDVVASGEVLDETFDDRFRMIRRGSRDNLWLRFKVRLTAPPFTVEIIKDEIECRGRTGGPLP